MSVNAGAPVAQWVMRAPTDQEVPKDFTTDAHKDIRGRYLTLQFVSYKLGASTVVTINVHEDAGGHSQMCDITGVPKISWTANGVFKDVFVENVGVHGCLDECQ